MMRPRAPWFAERIFFTLSDFLATTINFAMFLFHLKENIVS